MPSLLRALALGFARCQLFSAEHLAGQVAQDLPDGHGDSEKDPSCATVSQGNDRYGASRKGSHWDRSVIPHRNSGSISSELRKGRRRQSEIVGVAPPTPLLTSNTPARVPVVCSSISPCRSSSPNRDGHGADYDTAPSGHLTPCAVQPEPATHTTATLTRVCDGPSTASRSATSWRSRRCDERSTGSVPARPKPDLRSRTEQNEAHCRLIQCATRSIGRWRMADVRARTRTSPG